MKNKLRNKKGITLIALVITIIVLLILAGVSISMISSQDGILNKATTAKETQKNATELERVNLAAQSALIEGEGTIDIADTTGTAKGSLKKALIEEFGSTSSVVTGYTAGKVTIGEKQYSVSATGAVAEIKAQWTLTTDSGDTGLSVGDLVTSKKKTTEQFYVIGIDGDTVSLLAAKNITTAGTLEQSTSAPTVVFSNTTYWLSETSYPLDLNKYTDKTDAEKTNMGVVSTDAIEIARAYGESLDVKGRLMTYEEVKALENVNSTILYGQYETGKYLSYWLGSVSHDDDVYFVSGSDSSLYGEYWGDVGYFGVRPVVEVSISSIQ